MKKKLNIKIYIAAHKRFDFIYDENIYCPIHVGSEGKKELGYKNDSTGINISSKNNCFCELTGMYWIWKNIKCDIVGLVHYRRYFYNKPFTNKKNILTNNQIMNLLSENDIILPRKDYILFSSVRDQYKKRHYITDIDKCYEIIKKDYPTYIESFQKVLGQNYLYSCNMLITKKKIFDDYCEWLFDILFKLEKQIDISDRDNYNKRVYGFISERLFNVWLDKNRKYKIVEKPVFNTEKDYLIQNCIRFIKFVLSYWRKNGK